MWRRRCTGVSLHKIGYPTNVSEILNKLVESPPQYRIPPEILEFVKINVIIKPHAYLLRTEIILPECTKTILSSFNSLCRGLDNADVLDWVLFMVDGNDYINGLYYVNCIPDSEYYGHIIVIHTDIHYTPTARITHTSVVQLMDDIKQWLAVTPRDVRAVQQVTTAEIIELAVNFLNVPHSRSVCYTGYNTFSLDTTLRDILIAERTAEFNTKSMMKCVKEINRHVMSELIYPVYGVARRDYIVDHGLYYISFTNFLFRNRA